MYVCKYATGAVRVVKTAYLRALLDKLGYQLFHFNRVSATYNTYIEYIHTYIHTYIHVSGYTYT
jgi:hypothetical protein